MLHPRNEATQADSHSSASMPGWSFDSPNVGRVSGCAFMGEVRVHDLVFPTREKVVGGRHGWVIARAAG